MNPCLTCAHPKAHHYRSLDGTVTACATILDGVACTCSIARFAHSEHLQRSYGVDLSLPEGIEPLIK